jgi:hypothetical protein
VKRYTILQRLHRSEEFESLDDRKEFEAKLGDLVKKGIIEVVPTVKHRSSMSDEAWFRDKRNGIVYSYTPPDFPSRGHWGPVEKPEQPSYFESLCGDIYPTKKQYDELVKTLDAAWRTKEVEHGLKPKKYELVTTYWYHPGTDEAYSLILANPYQAGGCWMRMHRSKKEGTWPGDIVVQPPPWVKKE